MLIPILRWLWSSVTRPHRQAMLKTTVAVIAGACMAMTLLDLRFAQQSARHEQGQAFRKLDDARKEVWDSQAEIGERTHPLELMDRLDPNGVETLPVVDSDLADEDETAITLADWAVQP
ncbi:hypothetical protein [Mucisphaera calidilacus]|uniref:Cell division protein FtsL n=1 Tax=Mucisphaera calidilacus TaxID=2527982 RepID=A0A518BVM8_9BACT|nr:hypothetical protein [Mucisphaera calidilacus]QDU70994.1 hypothetical protein Pan265_08380 [Mucisphaera calidilacus]